jgi:nucleoside-diphosphate-sugar epimerase
MKILVTGAAGFVPSHLIDLFYRKVTRCGESTISSQESPITLRI